MSYPNVPYFLFIVCYLFSLGAGMNAQQAAAGVKAVVGLLLAMRPHMKIILLPILPRGEKITSQHVQTLICSCLLLPFAAGDHRQSASTAKFADLISAANAILKKKFSQTASGLSPQVDYAGECGDVFQSKDGSKILSELMPDYLHPNAEGTKLIGSCIKKHMATMHQQDKGI